MIGGKDSYALVTGASSGMGYEYAKLFAKDGKNIVVLARSRDKLEGLKRDLEKEHGTKVMVLVKDLADPKAPQEVFSELEKVSINVDVLVNNAGFGVYGKFQNTDWQKEAEMIQVNIIALTQLTKLFLKKMLENKSGKILNISSGVGLIPAPWSSVYGGTKHYVLGFSNAIAHELKGTGVSVTCFCPGNTRTPFFERGGAEGAKMSKRRMLEMDAATAARHGYKALARGKTTAGAGLTNSFMFFVVRLVPRSLSCSIMNYMLQPENR
ncbi:MAG: SDR family oxidoreductase [Deltaproteobacteria bacterium]|nr:SDR family oxidoreductase [Deltaproteobacteria bacterium]